jgi:hypothetical protein
MFGSNIPKFASDQFNLAAIDPPEYLRHNIPEKVAVQLRKNA